MGQVDLVSGENEIDFDALKTQICVEDTGVYIPTDGIAKGNDAFTVLEWPETRHLLLNDLIKVYIVRYTFNVFLYFKFCNFF